MADTKVLRQRLEEQLRQIQEKLRAIDIVEAMSSELGVNGSEPAKVVVRLAPVSSRSIVETCKAIAVADPVKHWNVATMTPEVQRAGRTDASRANVTTSLRRLAEQGVLEVLSRNKKVGYAYRARTAKAAS